MKLRPMLWGEADEQAIATLKVYAEGHPFTRDQVDKLSTGALAPPGDWSCFTILIPFGFRIVFTISNLSKTEKDIICRQLSMSVSEPGKLPSEAAVGLVMERLGFTCKLTDTDCIVSYEDIGLNHQAISIVEIIKPKE